MEESVTYQAIFAIGEARGFVRGMRKAVLSLARDRFGQPTDRQKAMPNAIRDVRQLEQLIGRLF